MDILKKILVVFIALGILSALFFVGIAFFAVVLILFPIIYFYQRYKMNSIWTNAAQAGRAPEAEQSSLKESKIIEAEYETIEEKPEELKK